MSRAGLMIVDCISDLHGHYPQLEGGDLLIVAGDLTASDSYEDYLKFCQWISNQNYSEIIFIAGNHDNILVKNHPCIKKNDNFTLAATYLCDSGTKVVHYPPIDKNMPHGAEIERQDFKVWGSPWTLRFAGMNPACMAFTCETDEELAEKWAMIPDDVDILVTHSPPYGLLDITKSKESVGSISLRNRAFNLENIKLFVFGHIHEMGGRVVDLTCMKVINASHVNERYEPVNKPIRIELCTN